MSHDQCAAIRNARTRTCRQPNLRSSGFICNREDIEAAAKAEEEDGDDASSISVASAEDIIHAREANP